MTIHLSEKEHKLLNYFLDQLEDELDNAGCNDLDSSIIKLIGKDGEKFAEEVNKIDSNRKAEWPYLFDTDLLDLLRNKIKK